MKKLIYIVLLTFCFNSISLAVEKTGKNDRDVWVKTMLRIADPVLRNIANETLEKEMPYESLFNQRKNFCYLEAFGRTLCGIAPWLELGPDNSPEGKLRAKYIDLTLKGLRNAVNPDSPDYLNFREPYQPLVDAAFLAEGLLRAPNQLWNKMDQATQQRMIKELKSSRIIKPSNSNWLLFASMVEAALYEFTGECDETRLMHGIEMFRDKWYKGDGQYGDGFNFHMDYYNSFVIHPMLTDVLRVMKKHQLKGYEFLDTELLRLGRYAEELERMISPEGTYPVIGRSIVYRLGCFHALGLATLLHQLPNTISPAQVRSGLTAVIKKQFSGNENFDAKGWLRVGFNGSQLNISEGYINTGSLYLCMSGFLPLGLPTTDDFWTAPSSLWTNAKAWSGKEMKADHSLYESKSKKRLKYGAQRIGKRQDAAMQRWRDNRFGQFIHFGLYSELGGSWNGKNYKGAAEWIKAFAGISNKDYETLQKTFNPIKFDASKWASIAKEMGVKYSVITTKHHEGFCLWPSKYTDYTISNTLYKKDLLKEYVDAYNKAGIDVYLYYSVIDWHHPDWRGSIKSESDRLAFERYKKWMILQIEELMHRYPTVKGFWFDGTWDSSMVHSGSFTYDVQKVMHAINPDIICGSRLRVDDLGSRHFDSNGLLMGDYEQGWERSLPDEPLKNDWEGVMTIPENQWGYHANWEGHIKNANEIIEMLAKATSLSGNFVLNFGPKGDGSIRKEEQSIAKEIGKWMKINSEAIYGCEHTKFKMQKWGYFTGNKKTGKTYMIITNMPYTGELKVQVPKGVVIDHGILLSNKHTILGIEKSTMNEYVIKLPNIKGHAPFVIQLILSSGDSTGYYIAPKV